MLDRTAELIAKKKEEIRSELTRWAKAHLAPGEQIVFELTLVSYPIAIERNPTRAHLLEMDIESYLTLERWLAAGCEKKTYARAFNCLLGRCYIYVDGRWTEERAKIMADVVSIPSGYLVKIPNCGKITAAAIEMVLKHDGLRPPK